MQDALAQYRNAIAAVESDGSGGYSAIGPQTKKGDRAYGRYQVMGSNIPEWSKAALGTALTPSQFLNSPEAQDAVFNHRFGGYVQQYGNPQDAASAWFTGRPQTQGGSSSDGYISGNEYVRRFNKALGGNAGGALAYADTPADAPEPALSAINSALAAPVPNKGTPMPDSGNSVLKAALGDGGIGDTLQGVGAWLQAANNPSGAASLLQQLQAKKALAQQMAISSKPQLVDAGADPISGKKRFVLFDPMTRTVTPFNGNGAASVGGSKTSQGVPGTGTDDVSLPDTDQFSAAIMAHRNGQLDDNGLRKAAGPILSDYADALAKGTADPKNLGMKAGAMRPYSILLAHELNKDIPFDENSIEARKAYNRLLGTGSNNPATLPGALASAGKLSDHALKVANASKALHDVEAFPDNATANEIQNWIKARGSDTNYNGRLNELNSINDTYSKEQDRLASGGHPTVSGLAATSSTLSAEKAHSVRMKALGVSLDAALAPLEQMNENHNQLFGEHKTALERLGPEAQENIAKVRKMIADAQTQQAPASSSSPNSGFKIIGIRKPAQ